jgi:hypothetical protein
VKREEELSRLLTDLMGRGGAKGKKDRKRGAGK